MSDPQGTQAAADGGEATVTLTDDEIRTRPLATVRRAGADTGDDTGDTSDTSDTGDDSGDAGDAGDAGDGGGGSGA